MIFALVGNQNCGKTTLFNALTGSNQHVGNFPGVTVEQTAGEVKGTRDCTIVDLPGIYSIRPYSSEEIVTRDFVLKGHPDGIINIVDATNIERNLYLTLQLLELRLPTVIALNMMDEVRGNGGSVDIRAMSERIGVPIVPISAAKNEGISELIDQAIETVKSKRLPARLDFCRDGAVHRCIHAVSHVIEDHAERNGVAARFAATKIIEGDKMITDSLGLTDNELELIEHSVVEMETEGGLDRNAAIAAMRYDFIEGVCRDTVKKPTESRERKRSIAIDRIVTNKYLALPIFFGIMFLVFWLTFGVIGKGLSDLLALGIDALSALADRGLTAWGVNPVVHSLIIDGIFTGIGSVLSFLPLIVVLFFFLSILEDTGYMARVAFVMDKLMRKIGLSGRSFVPLLIGFGCSVPAILSARTLSSDRDRRLTVMLIPFMSCSAKIPIYAIFSAAFFPKYAAFVMIGLYVGGMVLAVLAGLILKHTVFRGKPVPFVMELPNYRFPTAKTVGLLLWQKAKDFLSRAFTVIFLATIVIWFLQSFDVRLNVVSDSSDSILALIGRWIAPIFIPLGFGDWRAATALISGFVAKEAVVSTLGVLTGTSMTELSGALGAIFTTRAAVSFLVFTLLYTPCVAAITTIKRELGSRSRAAMTVVGQCAIAWCVAAVVYQVARLF
jgi:ferrous iron transport protein B